MLKVGVDKFLCKVNTNMNRHLALHERFIFAIVKLVYFLASYFFFVHKIQSTFSSIVIVLANEKLVLLIKCLVSS